VQTGYWPILAVSVFIFNSEYIYAPFPQAIVWPALLNQCPGAMAVEVVLVLPFGMMAK
jgi:hypothetical protein